MNKLIVISPAILLLGCSDDSTKEEESSQSGLESATGSPKKTTQKRASGSATFIDTTAVMTTGSAKPVKGTFEVECN